MRDDLAQRRRLLARAYHDYVAADLAWRAASRAARGWFPAGARPQGWPIGDPGSHVRRLHEARERALLRLFAARAKLAAARGRRAAARWEMRLLIRA